MYTAVKRIRELREQGWKVKVRIERVIGIDQEEIPIIKFASRGDSVDRTGEDFLPRGGRTCVMLYPPDNGDPFLGISRCHIFKDNFNKKIGLEIAFARAWKEYEARTGREDEVG